MKGAEERTRRRSLALAAGLALLAPARATAQELAFGPELRFDDTATVLYSTLAATVTTAGNDALFAWWARGQPSGWGGYSCDQWARPVGPEGEPLGPARLIASGECSSSIAWTGSGWAASFGTHVRMLGADGDVGWDLHPADDAYGITVTPREQGALALWTDGQSTAEPWLSAVAISADGSLGRPFIVTSVFAAPLVAAWDGERTILLGSHHGAPRMLWLGSDSDAPVESDVTLTEWNGGTPACLAADASGNVAAGWLTPDNRLSFAVFDREGTLLGSTPEDDEPAGCRCSIVPTSRGFRAFWACESLGGGSRGFDREGNWTGGATALPGYDSAARVGDATLVAWGSWAFPITDEGEGSACDVKAVAADERETQEIGAPSIAWTGSDYLAVWQADAGDMGLHHLAARVGADGAVVGPAPFDIGIGLGARCDRIACARPDWCAMACWEEGGGGQGGDSGGPAIGWLEDGRLVARARTWGTTISALVWDGERFVLAGPGNPAWVQWSTGAEPALEGAINLLGEGRLCSVGTEPEGLLVGCLATGAPAWIARVDIADGSAVEVARLPEATLLAIDDSSAAWIDADDLARSLRWSQFGPDGFDDAGTILSDEVDDSMPAVMVQRGGDSLLGYSHAGVLEIARLSRGESPQVTALGPFDPMRVDSSAPAFGVAASTDSVAIAYLAPSPSGPPDIRLRVAPGEPVHETDAGCSDVWRPEGGAIEQPDGGTGGNGQDDGGGAAPHHAQHATGGCAAAPGRAPAAPWWIPLVAWAVRRRCRFARRGPRL